MCNCQTCGDEKPEYELNEAGDCETCAENMESLINAVCDSVDVPKWEFELC